VIRLAVALSLCLGYALGLVGRTPFWLATALFVTSFIVVFEWTDDGNRMARLAWALAIGIAAGVGISYVFSELFLVRLP
jgi:putative tricarboxylic transport membrane protein